MCFAQAYAGFVMPLEIAARALFPASIAATALPGLPPSWPMRQVRPCDGRALRVPIALNLGI